MWFMVAAVVASTVTVTVTGTVNGVNGVTVGRSRLQIIWIVLFGFLFGIIEIDHIGLGRSFLSSSFVTDLTTGTGTIVIAIAVGSPCLTIDIVEGSL